METPIGESAIVICMQDLLSVKLIERDLSNRAGRYRT